MKKNNKKKYSVNQFSPEDLELFKRLIRERDETDPKTYVPEGEDPDDWYTIRVNMDGFKVFLN